MYKQGELIELLTAYPIRLMADGRTGVAYEGWVYPLLKGNVIILGEPAHQDESVRKHCVPQESNSSANSTTSGRPAAIDRWTFESNGPVHYIKFDAADDARERLITRLNASGLRVVRCVRSARRAKDGRNYAWSIRLGFSGPRQECEQRVRAILEHFVSESDAARAGRRQRRTDTAVVVESRSSVPTKEPRPDADEHFAGSTAGAVEKLSFEVLPPGPGVRGLAAIIRRVGNYVEEELDLRRLQVLINVQLRFPERRSRRYASGFPLDEKDNRYVVLVLTAPNGCEDAIAMSPLRGQHATFLVRHGIAGRSWETVLSMTKAEAVEFGADRLIFKSRREEGLDEYEAMLTKIVELLEGDSAPKEAIDDKLLTRRQASQAIDDDEGVSTEAVSGHVTCDPAPKPSDPYHRADLPIACVAETPKQLDDLFHDKHRYWRPAAFASLLVQGVGRNNVLVDDDIHPCVVPLGSLVTSVGQLDDLVDEVVGDVEGRAQALARYVVSAPFLRLFDPSADDPSPDDIAAAAKYVVNFYEANLLLAYRVRGTDSPRRYRKVLESTAHLVDRNLKGVDQFITEYIDSVRALPSLEQKLLAENASHIVPLNLHQDNQLLKRLRRRVKVLGWMYGRWPR